MVTHIKISISMIVLGALLGTSAVTSAQSKSIASVGKSTLDGAIIPVGTTPKVEIFVTSWCPYCKKLEVFLRGKKIKFDRYDIESDARGRALYEGLGGGGVPVVRIGTTVISGFSEEAINSALEGEQEKPSASVLGET